MSFFNQLMTTIGAGGPGTNPAENFAFGVAKKFLEAKGAVPPGAKFLADNAPTAAPFMAAAKPNLELLRGEQAATSVLDKAMRRLGRG